MHLGYPPKNLFIDIFKSGNPPSENQYFLTYPIPKELTILVFETLKNIIKWENPTFSKTRLWLYYLPRKIDKCIRPIQFDHIHTPITCTTPLSKFKCDEKKVLGLHNNGTIWAEENIFFLNFQQIYFISGIE